MVLTPAALRVERRGCDDDTLARVRCSLLVRGVCDFVLRWSDSVVAEIIVVVVGVVVVVVVVAAAVIVVGFVATLSEPSSVEALSCEYDNAEDACGAVMTACRIESSAAIAELPSEPDPEPVELCSRNNCTKRSGLEVRESEWLASKSCNKSMLA